VQESFVHDGFALCFTTTHELALRQGLRFGQIDPIPT
jgi:hypothetical protein